MITTRQAISRQTPALPTDHAFVVQFSRHAGGSPAYWTGRVEHVVSGRAVHFASWGEIQTFMEQMLAEVRGKPP